MIRHRDPDARLQRAAPAAGFTLAEVLVGMIIGTALVLGVLTLFDMNSTIARSESMVADMQQSIRIAQYDLVRQLRATGRGGLPTLLMPDATAVPAFEGRILPTGVAVEVQNNVAAETTIGADGTPEVLEGTDVLILRGVFASPVYQVDVNGFNRAGGTLQINRLSPSGVNQDLQPLADAVQDANGGDPEAVVLVSPLGGNLYGVAELSGGGVASGTVDGVSVPIQITLNLAFTGGSRATAYRALTPGGALPAQVTTVAYVGVLEEYRYYVRAARAVPGDDTSELKPQLARARFYPGTQTIHPSVPGAGDEIAEGIVDLQVALGVDLDGDGLITEGTDDASLAADEWLFNSPDDVPDDPDTAPGTWQWNGAGRRLVQLRLTTLARSGQRDLRYVSAAIDRLEDQLYSEADNPTSAADRLERMFRRRRLTTTVDLRNL